MSKRARQSPSTPSKPAKAPASKQEPAKVAAKPASTPAAAAEKPASKTPAKASPAAKPASAAAAKPASKTTAKSGAASKAASAATDEAAAKQASATEPKAAPRTGVSARAIQKEERERLREIPTAEPAGAPVGRVRKVVETVIAYAEKLGEEVIERITGEAAPVPASAYLSPRSEGSASEPVPASAYLSPRSEPTSEPVPATEYLRSESTSEPVPASAWRSEPVPEDSLEGAWSNVAATDATDDEADLVAAPPAQAIDVDVPPTALAPADDPEADALASDVAPIPAAYLATPPRTPSPVVYLADLPGDRPADPRREPQVRPDPRLSDYDRHLFAEGKHLGLFDKLGAQLLAEGGVHFAVWAPNAQSVRVMGEFNGWDPERDQLRRDAGGVWSGVVAGARAGMLYKYRVVGLRGEVLDKADPCAQATEMPPETASRIAEVTHRWNDGAWLAGRAQRQAMSAPMAVYELHLGSWMRGPAQEFLSYRELAPRLIAHVQALGFTHVEFMPLTEHPFYGSWGYQSTGYYAPTARFGAPEELMALIDQLHQAGIGVILDWVPAHFPADAHGLARFDGTRLYEHHDWRRGLHPDWNTLIFNLSRPEVQSFLLSSVMLWIERFHIDGIRVDAVASMLYLDYSRKEGQWAPNEHGGRENLESVAFLRELNRVIHERHPGVLTIAEDSTAWPLVTAPSVSGGLGFDLKWDMGWMHDTLRYLGRDPIARQHHHNELTFRMMYAYKERFMLPLSHDEVVHGKGSLVRKMHGDSVAKFAGLRLLFGYMFTSPGHKLLFMGDEFAQVREWNHDRALDWSLREQPRHAGLERWVQRIAHLYRDEPGLHELDHDPAGFEWLIVDDRQRSLIVYLRLPASGPAILVALNFTPVTWTDQRVGLPGDSRWTLLTRSDAPEFTDQPETPAIPMPETFEAAHDPTQDHPYALTLTVPPLTAVLLKGPDAADLRAAARRARSEKLAREAAQAAVEAMAAAAAAEAAAAAVEAEATVLMPPETDVEPRGTGEGTAVAGPTVTKDGVTKAAVAKAAVAKHTVAEHTAAIVADGKPDAPGSVGER